MKIYTLIIIGFFILFVGCSKDPIIPIDTYDCTLSFSDNSSLHPKRMSFENTMKNFEQTFPGIQVSVRSLDGKIWTGSQGFADINNNAIMKNCSKFLIGSVSKTFTAVVILKLQEEGLLSIEDPISDWLEPEIIDKIENADVVTIKNLLMHNSGIKEYLAIQFQIERLNTSKLLLTPTQKLDYVFNKSADFAPNEKYGYSNTNYILLGLIAEKVKNMPLQELKELYISNIIGLKNTVMGTIENPIPLGTTRPYLDVGNGKYQEIMDFALSDAATGDGGIISNTQDLLFFMESIVDNTVISSMSYDAMLSNRVEIKTDKWYGLGIEQEDKEYGFRLSHTGGAEGYTTFLMSYPDSNVTIAVCLNSSSEDKEILQRLRNFVLELQQIAFE